MRRPQGRDMRAALTGVEAAVGESAKRAFKSLAALKLAADRRGASPEADRLLGVLLRWLRDDFDVTDRTWFATAESQRRALLARDEVINKTDFGAGAHDERLSAAVMAAGVSKVSSVAAICRQTSKSAFWARLLYALVAEYGPRTALELGTSVGVSALYQAGPLVRGGRLTTIEGAPEVAAVAEGALAAAGLGDVVDVRVGRFSEVLPGLLASSGPFQYVFVDGHHDEAATLEYHRLLKPHLTPDAVLVYDDIHWSAGMERAWATIVADPDVAVSMDLAEVGVAVIGNRGGVRSSYGFGRAGVAVRRMAQLRRARAAVDS